MLIFLYLNLVSIFDKKEDRELMLWRKKIKTNTFRWLIFFFQYFCLGLHSYEQKKLLVKISDIYLFLRFCSHFFHLFRQWSNTPQNFVLCIVLFKENLQFVKQFVKPKLRLNSLLILNQFPLYLLHCPRIFRGLVVRFNILTGNWLDTFSS